MGSSRWCPVHVPISSLVGSFHHHMFPTSKFGSALLFAEAYSHHLARTFFVLSCGRSSWPLVRLAIRACARAG